MEIVYQYFKKNLNYYNQVFIYMRTYIILFGIGAFASIITFFEVLWHKESYLGILISFIPFTVALLIFNSKAKKVTMERYNIKSNTFRWNDTIVENYFNELDKSKIKDALEEKKLESPRKIRLIIKIFEDRAKRNKFKFPVFPSMLAALFISIWNNIFSWLLDRNYFNTLEKVLKLGAFGVVLIAMLWGLHMMIKGVFEIMFIDIFDYNYYKMKRFIRLLQEIELEIDED